MTGTESRLAMVQSLIAQEPAQAGDGGGTMGWLQRLCRAARDSLEASGAGISVMTEDGSRGMAVASDRTSELVEELQFTLGEGPCLDAFADRRPALASDLGEWADTRWPAYAAAANGNGFEAAFAFPLQIGAARLGALDVYRARPGPLLPEALALALTFAEVAMMGLLDGQEQTGMGRPATGLDDVLGDRAQVHQAQGMVKVQLGLGLVEAMARLRAYAYAEDRSLSDVARDVVTRKLVFERDAL